MTWQPPYSPLLHGPNLLYIEGFAREPNGGLIVMPSPIAPTHRELIIALAAHRLPAIYPFRYFPEYGGLSSYGIDMVEVYRRAHLTLIAP
jgi:putative ABC transport system substrate-binding protein